MRDSNIQWTDCTHNFWSGCKKVSAGCKFCYMHRIIEGNGKNASQVKKASQSYFYRPIHEQVGKLIFTCSMSDFFIEEADQWRTDAWGIIRDTPQHTWQILTKRPERIRQCLPADWGDGYPNVWLGVSIENNTVLDRLEVLSKIPARIRFISAEPLLEEIDFLNEDKEGNLIIDKFQWMIIGGESGNEKGKYLYRPCKLKWINTIVSDLKEHSKVRVFVKQLGTYLSKIGKMNNSHGDDFNRFPEYLKYREMPIL